MQVWLCLLWVHCSFLLVPVTQKVLFVPSKSLFLQCCGSSVINSNLNLNWPPTLNSLRVLCPFAGSPTVGKSVVGLRNFLTVWEFIWYNCSSVCMSSVWRLYVVANGDILQEGLCPTLGDTGTLHPEPLSSQQATAELCLHRRHSNTQKQVWLSFCGVSWSWCTQGFVWALRLSMAGIGFDSNMILPLLSSVGASLMPLDLGILCVCVEGGIQHSPVNGCSAVICNFGVLTQEDECTSFYSDILFIHSLLEKHKSKPQWFIISHW